MSEASDVSNMYTDELNAHLAQKAEECYQMLRNASAEAIHEGAYCEGVFDGWACWPDTPAGEVASQSCPDFVIGFDPNRTAYKICEDNGEWFFHAQHNKTWSNYTTCVNEEDLLFRQLVITVYTVGYSVSLVALLTSLGILGYFKSLRCARITVHMNLFASFAINNLLWLLWYNLVVSDVNIVTANETWCKVLHVVLMLFLISNYSWMLCEGLYLHTVLVSAFVSETKLLRCMLALGWCMPIGFILMYAFMRSVYHSGADDSKCWMEDTVHNRILAVPVVGTVISNLIFLFNILRVLCMKLRKQPQGDSGASRASLQALRATLLLIPLLGLNYLLTPFRPEPGGSSWEYVYEIVSAITASLQGLCVAILFCFCNGEVVAQMKRKWRTATFRPRANSCTVTTVSFVRSSYPNGGEEKI